MPTLDNEAAASNSGSDTAPSVVSTSPSPLLSNHNSDIFAQTDGTEDMWFSANDNIQHYSDNNNTNIPDTMINHNIKSKDNQMVDKMLAPLSKLAPVWMNNMLDLASASWWLKWTIKPRLQDDQTDMSENKCANLDCEDPRASREMVECTGLGCHSKVSLVLSMWDAALIPLSFIIPASLLL